MVGGRYSIKVNREKFEVQQSPSYTSHAVPKKDPRAEKKAQPSELPPGFDKHNVLCNSLQVSL